MLLLQYDSPFPRLSEAFLWLNALPHPEQSARIARSGEINYRKKLRQRTGAGRVTEPATRVGPRKSASNRGLSRGRCGGERSRASVRAKREHLRPGTREPESESESEWEPGPGQRLGLRLGLSVDVSVDVCPSRCLSQN
jgi:hypothetical protein